MSLVRRAETVRMSVEYEGVRPLTIIIAPAGSGPCLLETRNLSFRYEGSTITPQQERILRSVAERLGEATFDEVARDVEQERAPDAPVEDPGGITVEEWGADDAWRRFVFRREFARNASSALRVTGRRVVTVSHGESECQYATPSIDARAMTLLCYPWVRPLSRTPDDRATERTLPAFITTDMRDADIITGGTARLDAVLDALADRTGEGDTVVVQSTCVPHVIGDDMEASVRRWGGRGDIVFEDVFAPGGGNLVAGLLAAAIDSGGRRKRSATISLAGLAPGRARDDLQELLAGAGVTVGCAQVPHIDLETAPAWRSAALQVLVPSPYLDEIYEGVFRPLDMQTIEAPAPWGVAGTRRWLARIADGLGRGKQMSATWRAAMRASAAERKRVRGLAARQRLGFVVDEQEASWLGEPEKMAGVPLLGMVTEMGFGIDLMVHGDGKVEVEAGGVKVHGFESREAMEALMRDLPCGAIYSDLYCDARITAAGKMPFSLQMFEPGLQGAVRTARRLAHACRADFYRKYRRHGTTC
jgi:nitrogenase molybdenum-iron protein alpha/beta subunit